MKKHIVLALAAILTITTMPYTVLGMNTDKQLDLDNQLFDAAFLRKNDVIKDIIKRGANVNAIDKDGNTPLLIALKNTNPSSAEILLELGADPNIKNHKGEAAIGVACLLHYWSTVKTLLRYGADPNIPFIKNSYTYSPLEFAFSSRKDDVIEALRNYGADMHQIAFINSNQSYKDIYWFDNDDDINYFKRWVCKGTQECKLDAFISVVCRADIQVLKDIYWLAARCETLNRLEELFPGETLPQEAPLKQSTYKKLLSLFNKKQPTASRPVENKKIFTEDILCKEICKKVVDKPGIIVKYIEQNWYDADTAKEFYIYDATDNDIKPLIKNKILTALYPHNRIVGPAIYKNNKHTNIHFHYV